MRLIIVGDPQAARVGAHINAAAARLGLAVQLCDVRDASRGPRWRQALSWRLHDRRPLRLDEFCGAVVESAREWKPDGLIATGLAPLDEAALRAIGALRVLRLNYLTDDPWNPAHRSRWFMQALPHYDHVFSPRRSNLQDLAAVLGSRVSYLPFAFAPDCHFPAAPMSQAERQRFDSDVVFVGGADHDRIGIVRPFIDAGFSVALYGAYWTRYRATRRLARGQIGPEEHRKAIGGGRVSLCLVRRANRDGHAMRTFEEPAMGGCMLVEDTGEHRDIFGVEGEAVRFFRTPAEAVQKVRELLACDQERTRLAAAALARVRVPAHSYDSRLRTMLATAGLWDHGAHGLEGRIEAEAGAQRR